MAKHALEPKPKRSARDAAKLLSAVAKVIRAVAMLIGAVTALYLAI